MVTNLMLFLLASISAGIIFTQIDTVIPDHTDAAPVANPAENPDDQKLELFVSITREKMFLWSRTGLEGSLDAPKVTFLHTGHDGDSCDGNYMCETNFCNADTGKCQPPPADAGPVTTAPVFDYRALSNALDEIATRRYTGKPRKRETYQITLQADGTIPYNTIASVMAAMRCHLPEFGKEPTGCALPTDDPNLKKAKDPISPDGRVYDTDRAPYDPKKMALFSDILFSTGFE
jgi:hypothetical protein